jgi:citrate synthase
MKTIAEQLAELCRRPLDEGDMALLELLCEAHEAAAKANPNASNQMAAFMGEAHVPLQGAFIGALAIIGGKHAPIAEIRRFWESGYTREAGLVPGWGNSFYKDGPDPSTIHLRNFLEMHKPEQSRIIARQTEALHAEGKRIFPNIGLYTAVVANIISFPYGAELALVVLPRLATWTKLFMEGRAK